MKKSRHQLIEFDPFDTSFPLENTNIIVAATSGSGQSFLMQAMFSQDHSGRVMPSYDAMQLNVQRYGEEYGWSKEQSNQVAKSLAFGGESTSNNLTSNYLHSLNQEETEQLNSQRQTIHSYMTQLQSMAAQGQELSKSAKIGA